MITILNNKIACKPLASRSIQKNDNGKGFVTAKEMTELLELEVVYSDAMGGPPPGTKVYVRGDTKTYQWMKDVFELGGQKVILVPVSELQAVSYETSNSQALSSTAPGLETQVVCK